MSTVDTDLPVQDELVSLKSRADFLGVSYHPSISLAKLREKVNAAVTGEKAKEEAPAAVAEGEETVAQKRMRLKREATALVRIRVSCMNPAKKEWEGELFTCGNATIGSFTKYVPFNNDEGWHVPRIILNQMQERQCQVFYTETDSRGNKLRKGKLIKEFNIEIMPQLTEDELRELARRQAMAKSID